MRSVSLLAVLASLALASTASATVVVHGLNQAPLGAATLTVSGTPGGSGQALVVANIGSSGNDGVSIDLPRTNGLWLVYGTPPPPAPGQIRNNLVHRDLAARLAQPQLAGVLYHFIENQGLSGTGVDLTFDLPGTPDLVVELFDGTTMVYSGKQGYSYYAAHAAHLDGPSVTVGEPGVAVAFRFGRPAINTALSTACSFEMVRPAPCDITLDGVTYSADRVKVSFPWLPSSPDARCVEALLHASCIDDGSGGSGDIAITNKGCPGVPVKRKVQAGPALSVVTGATLVDAGGTGNLQRLRVVPDTGPTPEAAVISLWRLPPGVPGLSRVMDQLSVEFDPSTFVMPQGESLTFEGQFAYSSLTPGAIAGIVIGRVTCAAAGPSGFAWTASSDEPGQGHHFELYRRGESHGVSLGGSAQSSGGRIDRALVAYEWDTDTQRFGFGMPLGTTVTEAGVTYPADSIVVVFDRLPRNWLGLVEATLKPSSGMPFTVTNTGEVPSGTVLHRKPTALLTWGSALVAESSDGTHAVSNLGSSGNDGVSYLTRGLGSISMPFPNGLDLLPGAGLECDADPCDDGECAPSATLKVIKHVSNIKWNVSSRFAHQGSNPLFIEAGGVVTEIGDSDGDGDPDFEVLALPGSTAPISELLALPGSTAPISELNFRHLGPYRECFALRFTMPVTLMCSGQPVPVDGARPILLWRNISGQPIGTPAPVPAVISLHGLPPGQDPWVAAIEGMGPEGVMASGTGSDDQLANNSIGGFPVIPTWVRVTYPGIIKSDPDGAGAELTRIYATDPSGNLDANGPTLRGLTELDTSDDNLVRGYVFTADLDSLPPGPEPQEVELSIGGTVGGVSYAKMASLTVTGAPGGHALLSIDQAPIPLPVECDAYLGGVLQASFSYTAGIDCDHAPITMALYKPPTPNHPLFAECRFRLPTVLSDGGIVVVCDHVILRPAGGGTVTQDIEVGSASLRLNGLPPGVPLRHVRFGMIVPGSLILATPGGGSGAGALPAQFAVSPAWPNPMRVASTVRFALPGKQHVRAVVMDVAGREVAALADADFEAGEHTLRWAGMGAGGAAVPTGLYFVRVEAAGKTKVTRITRLR